jgi:uncharacterized glyoxalase superfamily protein PhnB
MNDAAAGNILAVRFGMLIDQFGAPWMILR